MVVVVVVTTFLVVVYSWDGAEKWVRFRACSDAVKRLLTKVENIATRLVGWAT